MNAPAENWPVLFFPDSFLAFLIIGALVLTAIGAVTLLWMLFKDHISKVTVISEMADPFGKDVAEDITKAGIEYQVTNDIQTHLNQLDVIYMNSIAFLGDSYKELDSRFRLNKDSDLKREAVILHPLARKEELSPDLDPTPHNLYFSQAHGAVFIRQALLTAVLGRTDRMPSQVPTVD